MLLPFYPSSQLDASGVISGMKGLKEKRKKRRKLALQKESKAKVKKTKTS